VGPWGDNPTYHAPCFVLSNDAQETIVKQGGTSYTFVTDGIESALEKAQAASLRSEGNKDIRVLGGANAAQQYIKAGLLDEIQIHLAPVLLGEGIRLFEHLGSEQIKLERTEVIDIPGATHLTFRVVK